MSTAKSYQWEVVGKQHKPIFPTKISQRERTPKFSAKVAVSASFIWSSAPTWSIKNQITSAGRDRSPLQWQIMNRDIWFLAGSQQETLERVMSISDHVLSLRLPIDLWLLNHVSTFSNQPLLPVFLAATKLKNDSKLIRRKKRKMRRTTMVKILY